MRIRIVAAPFGEAPEWVRKAWIGIELPVKSRGTFLGSGVLSGPRSVLGSLLRLVTGRLICAEGYSVYATDAVDQLALQQPEAAQWWRTNCPHMLLPGKWFLFNAEACEPIPD